MMMMHPRGSSSFLSAAAGVTRPMSREEALGLKIMGFARSKEGQLMEDHSPPGSDLEYIKLNFKDLCIPRAPMVPLYVSGQDPSVPWRRMPAIALAVDQVHNCVQWHMDEYPASMHVTGELLRFMVEECGNNVNATNYIILDQNNVEVVRGTLLSRALVLGVDGQSQSINAGGLTLRHLVRLGADVNKPLEYQFHQVTDPMQQKLQELNGHSLLHVAFTMQCIELAQVLLEHGARFSQAVDPAGAMAFAMQHNACAEMIELCTRFKWQLTKRDLASEGTPWGTPLHQFALRGPGGRGIRGLLNMLIHDLWISPHLVDAQGRTAKAWAEEVVHNLMAIRQNIDLRVIFDAHQMVELLRSCMVQESSRGRSVAAVQMLQNSPLPPEVQRKVFGYLQDPERDRVLARSNYAPAFLRGFDDVLRLANGARQRVKERTPTCRSLR